MKILIINYSDQKGGAARAAFRLHRALIDSGVDSKMLVQEKFSDRDDIIEVSDKYQIPKAYIQNEFNKYIYSKSLSQRKSFFSAPFFFFFDILCRIEEL